MCLTLVGSLAQEREWLLKSWGLDWTRVVTAPIQALPDVAAPIQALQDVAAPIQALADVAREPVIEASPKTAAAADSTGALPTPAAAAPSAASDAASAAPSAAAAVAAAAPSAAASAGKAKRPATGSGIPPADFYNYGWCVETSNAWRAMAKRRGGKVVKEFATAILIPPAQTPALKDTTNVIAEPVP